ncbi:hypothetical protein COOONC_03641 [Cooperia oncophora]
MSGCDCSLNTRHLMAFHWTVPISFPLPPAYAVHTPTPEQTRTLPIVLDSQHPLLKLVRIGSIFLIAFVVADMVAWRAAGINYVRFSQIAAEVTRKCVKRTTKTVEAKPATLTVSVWENGKAVKKL